MMDLTYKKTVYFEGEPAKAIEIARNTFLPNGFEIIQNDESYLEVANNGFPWGRHRQPNPIKFISKASVSIDNGEITLYAELNGVKKFFLYASLFILGTAVFSLILLGIVFTQKLHLPINIILTFFGPFALFPFLIPITGVWHKNNAIKALDSLMNNMTSSSNLNVSNIVTEKTGSGSLIFTVFIIPVIAGALIVLLNLLLTNKSIQNKTIFNQLDEQTISFISQVYEQYIEQANQKNIHTNAHIYSVGNNFILYKSGLCYFQNKSGQTITEKIRITGTSNPNTKFYHTDGRVINTEAVKDNNRANFYHIYCTPEQPLAAGDLFYFFWCSDSRQLDSSLNKSAILKMQNHYGPPVIETFFVVLPHKLKLSNKDSPTSGKILDNCNVYWWTKEVAQDDVHKEEATILK